jgi:hypothetical protein
LKPSYRVLILGSSDVTASETGESGALPALLQAALEQRFPDTGWSVDSGLLYPMPNMAERAAAEIDRVQPDVVHLSMGTNTITEKTVLFAVRRRWPRLYEPAKRVFTTAKGLAGGATEGSTGVRGALFRAPRAAGRRIFGMASMLDPAAATEATRQTFDILAATGLPVIVRLAEGGVQQADQRAAAAPITRAYNDEVRRLCEAHGFPCFHLSTELGDGYVRTPDGLHAAYPTRVYSAGRVAALVGAVLGLEDTADTSVR